MGISLLDGKTNGYAFSIEELNENYLIIFHGDKDSYELEAAISTDEEGGGTIIVDLVIDDNIKSQLDEEYTYGFGESPEEALKNLAKNISPIISAFEDEGILKEVGEFLEGCIREEDPRSDIDDLTDMDAEAVGEILDLEDLNDDGTGPVDEETLDLFGDPEEF